MIIQRNCPVASSHVIVKHGVIYAFNVVVAVGFNLFIKSDSLGIEA